MPFLPHRHFSLIINDLQGSYLLKREIFKNIAKVISGFCRLGLDYFAGGYR
jgi:hypothetical protein